MALGREAPVQVAERPMERCSYRAYPHRNIPWSFMRTQELRLVRIPHGRIASLNPASGTVHGKKRHHCRNVQVVGDVNGEI